MSTDRESTGKRPIRIEVRKNGPYIVHGGVPLVSKTEVVSEYGEPLTWQKDAELETLEPYSLCRCGNSSNKPFCDRTHTRIPFDGTETASTTPTEQRQIVHEGGTRIVAKRDYYLCIHAGFCGNRFTNIERMVADSDDTQVRSQIMAMAERCPSGSYTYSIEEGGVDIEPDLPKQVAIVTEITSQGPIAGPLWVTGHISITRADGQPFETRNRVTLCRCGRSQNKPLCDGTHREAG